MENAKNDKIGRLGSGSEVARKWLGVARASPGVPREVARKWLGSGSEWLGLFPGAAKMQFPVLRRPARPPWERYAPARPSTESNNACDTSFLVFFPKLPEISLNGLCGKHLSSIVTFLPLAGANSQRLKVFEAVGGPPEACWRLLGPPGLTSDQGSGMRGHRGPGSRVELRLRRGVREGSGAKGSQRALGAGPGRASGCSGRL